MRRHGVTFSLKRHRGLYVMLAAADDRRHPCRRPICLIIITLSRLWCWLHLVRRLCRQALPEPPGSVVITAPVGFTTQPHHSPWAQIAALTSPRTATAAAGCHAVAVQLSSTTRVHLQAMLGELLIRVAIVFTSPRGSPMPRTSAPPLSAGSHRAQAIPPASRAAATFTVCPWAAATRLSRAAAVEECMATVKQDHIGG